MIVMLLVRDIPEAKQQQSIWVKIAVGVLVLMPFWSMVELGQRSKLAGFGAMLIVVAFYLGALHNRNARNPPR